MIMFIAKGWDPEGLAERIAAILYGKLPAAAVWLDPVAEDLWHVGANNNVVLKREGPNQWRLSFRDNPTDEQALALATLLTWRVGLTNVGVE